MEEHPFKRPKLHLFKKDASRRIKTSSATRNLQPIHPFEGAKDSSFHKLLSNNFNSINIGGGGTTTSSNHPGVLPATTDNGNPESSMYYHPGYYAKSVTVSQGGGVGVGITGNYISSDQENKSLPSNTIKISSLSNP